jgi:hypothetical protein
VQHPGLPFDDRELLLPVLARQAEVDCKPGLRFEPVALIRALADNSGLTAGLSRALADGRLLVHDRGRVLADLACAIADGGEAISDFRMIGDQGGLFGPVASVPVAWRALSEIGGGGTRTAGQITAAVNAARRVAWAQIAARHGGLPGIRIADKILQGVTCIRLDASVVTCHSDKELAEPNFKGFATTRCWLTATTLASRWPACCAAGRRAATPRPTQ